MVLCYKNRKKHNVWYCTVINYIRWIDGIDTPVNIVSLHKVPLFIYLIFRKAQRFMSGHGTLWDGALSYLKIGIFDKPRQTKCFEIVLKISIKKGVVNNRKVWPTVIRKASSYCSTTALHTRVFQNPSCSQMS